MTLRDQTIRGVFWSAIQNWGSALLGTAVFIVLSRMLGADAIGLLALANIVVVFIDIFLRQGFGQALVQRSELEPGHLDTAFWINVVTGVVLMLAVMTGAGWMAALYGEPRLGPVLQWLSLGLLIGALNNTPQAILQRNMAFKSLAIRSLVGVAGGGAVGISMALMGYGIWSLVGQHLTAAAIGTVVLWTASGFRPGFKVSVRHFRDLFAFGVHIIVAEMLAFLSRRSAGLLIGYFLGTETLGYYNVAQRLLRVMTKVLTQTVSSVAFATFSRLQHATDQMRQAFYTATQMTSAIAFPAFLGMAVLAPELIRGLFGEKWDASIPVLRILAFVGLLNSVGAFNGVVMLACGKPNWRLAIMFVNTAVNVTALLLVVQWGILAVAAAFVVRRYLLFPIEVWALRRLIGIEPITYLRRFAPPLAGSVAMALAVGATVHFLDGVTSVRATLATAIIIGIGVYVLAIHLIAGNMARQLRELARSAVMADRDDGT